MKTFTAALLVAALCLLAGHGAVQCSRVGPARQLQQFQNGLGEPFRLLIAPRIAKYQH